MKPVIQMNSRQLQRIIDSHVAAGLLKVHMEQIRRQLRQLGAVQYDLWLPETSILPLVIHTDERIEGIVYGKYRHATVGVPIIGRGALVATDRRVLLIDHKPLFMKCNEISYQVINGVSYSRAGFAGTVILHTHLGDVSVRTFNQQCAYNFVEAIENSILTSKEQSYDYVA